MGVAPADEIVGWADAPHKTTTVRAGYQRELDGRRAEMIQEFIEKAPQNILPSAALIALRAGSYDIERPPVGNPVLRVHLDETDLVARRGVVADQLRGRLSPEELASVSLAEAETEVESEEDPGDTAPPDSYLASLYAELVAYDDLPASRQADLDELVKTLTLPGLIIDGQHRIFGAKEVVGSVSIPVVFMPSLALSEQVFHFYVLNSKARPLDKRQLRSIISTSLSKKEIDTLYERFRQAGVNADEAQWTYRVGADVESPFRGLVSLRLQGDTAPIDDNVMDQVVGRFIRLPRQYAVLTKGTAWESDPNYDYRLSLFYAMWRTVKDTYPAAWDVAAQNGPGAQLFTKVSLLQTQEYILRTLRLATRFTRSSPFADPLVLVDQTATALARVPEKFYLQEWKRKQLDTNSGRAYFLEQLEAVAEAEGKFVGNFGLFKG